jgi:hypothetical protein
VLRSTRAELLRLRRWPALWITVGAELALNLLFLYVFSYVSYRSGGEGDGMAGDVPRDALLADMLPDAIPRVATQGMPMFAGALVLIVGALAAGSGYGWGTVKTVALQGPGRLAALTGTFAALAVFVVALVAALFAMDVGVSLLVATTESQPVVWPSAGDLAKAFGGGAGGITGGERRGSLLADMLPDAIPRVATQGMPMFAGALMLIVGALWSPIERVTDVLPGTAAGSLAGALGATPVSEPGGTPGVLTTLGGGPAAALLAVWATGFVVATGWLVRRRDIT